MATHAAQRGEGRGRAVRPAVTRGSAPRSADSPHRGRARYFDSSNAFALKYPPVPCHQFLAERDRALDPASPTGLIPLDLSAPLELEFPATTPLIMTYYARMRAGERLATRFKASGELYYVIAGQRPHAAGRGDDRLGAGRRLLPAGRRLRAAIVAGDADCVLWVITNEPQLAFEHLEPPAPEQRRDRGGALPGGRDQGASSRASRRSSRARRSPASRWCSRAPTRRGGATSCRA